MIIFSEFKDALEEAKWCADNERVRHYIFLDKRGYRVTPKTNSDRMVQPHIEVGFIHKTFWSKEVEA